MYKVRQTDKRRGRWCSKSVPTKGGVIKLGLKSKLRQRGRAARKFARTEKKTTEPARLRDKEGCKGGFPTMVVKKGESAPQPHKKGRL